MKFWSRRPDVISYLESFFPGFALLLEYIIIVYDMSQSHNDKESSLAPGATPVSLKSIKRIVGVIKDNHLNQKSFLEAWLSSTDQEIMRSQCKWASAGVGLMSTKRVLCAIRDILLRSKAGRVFWEEWVLSQVLHLVE